LKIITRIHIPRSLAQSLRALNYLHSIRRFVKYNLLYLYSQYTRIIACGLASRGKPSVYSAHLFVICFFLKYFQPLCGRPADIFNRLSGFFGQRDVRVFFRQVRYPSQTRPFRSAFICLGRAFFFKRIARVSEGERWRSTLERTLSSSPVPSTTGEGCPR